MSDSIPRILIVFFVFGAVAAAGALLFGATPHAGTIDPAIIDTRPAAPHAPAAPAARPDREAALAAARAAFARSPAVAPRIETDLVDDLGRPVTVSCASCHANLEPDANTNHAANLIDFHEGLEYEHGSLSCLSCHHAEDYNSLRLTDGRAIDFASVQRLCAQCHGPQARDYERRAHGGMMGFWDDRRGEAVRKSCIDCHDPHAPAMPAMVPTFRPHDRFLAAPSESEHGDDE